MKQYIYMLVFVSFFHPINEDGFLERITRLIQYISMCLSLINLQCLCVTHTHRPVYDLLQAVFDCILGPHADT